MIEQPSAPELPPGITMEEFRRHAARARANDLAAQRPLPGPLREAFAGGALRLGELRLRALCLGDFIALAALDHPIADGCMPRLAEDLTEQQWADLLFVLSVDARQMQDIVVRFSVQRPEKCIALTPEQKRSLARHVSRAFETAVGFAPAAVEGSESVEIGSGSETDGAGWWLMLCGLLMTSFHFTWDQVRVMPVSQAFAWQTCLRENNPMLERSELGYIAQETEEILKDEGGNLKPEKGRDEGGNLKPEEGKTEAPTG